MRKAKYFNVSHQGGENAVGLSYGPNEIDDTVEVDFDYDGDGRLTVGASGRFDLAYVSPKQLRKFAHGLLKLADKAEAHTKAQK
jgi:hypothetical protein